MLEIENVRRMFMQIMNTDIFKDHVGFIQKKARTANEGMNK